MKTKSYKEFRQGIHEAAEIAGRPLRIMFEVTYSCNFSCSHCYIPGDYRDAYKGRELTTREVFTVLDQLKKAGCLYLGFTGGEPFMRKDFIKILKHAKELGFYIIIYTNGSLMGKGIVSALKKIRPEKIDITIPGMSRISFQKVINVSGYYDRFFDAIKMLHKNKIPLGFKTCVVEGNKYQIKDIRRFAKSLGAPHRLDPSPSPRIDRGCNCEDLPHCGAGKMQAAITPAGELKMCVIRDSPRYSILDTSLNKCWTKIKMAAAANLIRGSAS